MPQHHCTVLEEQQCRKRLGEDVRWVVLGSNAVEDDGEAEDGPALALAVEQGREEVVLALAATLARGASGR